MNVNVLPAYSACPHIATVHPLHSIKCRIIAVSTACAQVSCFKQLSPYLLAGSASLFQTLRESFQDASFLPCCIDSPTPLLTLLRVPLLQTQHSPTSWVLGLGSSFWSLGRTAGPSLGGTFWWLGLGGKGELTAVSTDFKVDRVGYQTIFFPTPLTTQLTERSS